jgi:hypothetical protein
MRRREFLKLGASGAAVFALPDVNLFGAQLVRPAGAPASVAAAGLPRLAVAYCAQTAASASASAAVDRATAHAARLRPAEQLRAGDARLARDGAKLTLSGVVPDGSTLALARVQVDFQPFHSTPFHAWSYAAGSAAKQANFSVPIDAATGLNLWVDVQHAGEAAPRTTVLRFAVGDDAGTAKLRAGTYVVALDSAAGGWSDYRLEPLDQHNLGLYRVTGRGGVPANQPHLLLTVS